jgi:prophage antirepressor-like protein
MQTYKAQNSDLFQVDRVQDPDRNVWYKAKSVCVLLGFKNTSETIAKYSKEDPRKLHVGNGAASFYLSRKDVMRIAIASNSPSALAFHEWLIDVAESVFDTGAYISPDISPVQALQAIDKLSQVADLASPWEKMWSKPVLDLVRKFYGNFCDKTFWWKYIYDFLTPEERCKLDRLNPVDKATKQRKTRIHQWIEGEGEIKVRLTEKVNEVQVLLRTSTSRSDFETRYQKLLNAFQGELF